ncbi:hypothetical protein CHARACLAT_000373, partial [Characodon lateralis]|nr:hypothetical protein [Characodon lateralis]
MAEGAKPPSVSAARGSSRASQPSSLRLKGLELLRKVKVSVELLIALAALLSWMVVGVVMFDFVEYKAVPDVHQIITDPVQAVNDAVDEVSSLLNKFQECAPDLSNPSSTVSYAAEEVIEAKDAFVRYFSDDEGTFYPSYIDPVVIGRRAFHSTNDFMCGMIGSFRNTLCVIVDTAINAVLDIRKGTTDISFIDPVVLGRTFFSVINDAVGGIMGYIQDILCAILDTVLDISKGTADIRYADPVVLGRNFFSITNDAVSGIVGYIQDILCAILDTILDIFKGTIDISFVDPVVIGRNIFHILNEFVSEITGYIQNVLCVILDVVLDTLKEIQEAVGFSPLTALKTTAEMIKEQVNIIISYLSTTLIGEQAIIPDVSVDPMKVVEDAVLEFTDKKELFLGYMSSMLGGDQGEPVTPPVVNVVTEKAEAVVSPSDINLVRKKGEFLPPLEKVAEMMHAVEDEATSAAVEAEAEEATGAAGEARVTKAEEDEVKHTEEMQRKLSLKEEIIDVEFEKDRTVEEETVDEIPSKQDAEQLVHEEGQEEEEWKLKTGQEQEENEVKIEDILVEEEDKETPKTEEELEEQEEEEEKHKIEAIVEDKLEKQEQEPKTKEALVEGEETEVKEEIKREGMAQDQEKEEESKADEELIDSEGEDDRTLYEGGEEGLEKQPSVQQLDLLLSKTPVNNSAGPESGEHEEEIVGISPASDYTDDYTELKHDHDENNNNSETKKAKPELKRKTQIPFEKQKKADSKTPLKEHIDRYKT